MRFILAIVVLLALPLHMAWAVTFDCKDRHDAVAVPATPISFPAPAPAVGFTELSSIADLGGAPELVSITDYARNSAIDLTALALMAEQFEDWEFFDDEPPHIVDQLSALDLRDVSVDRLSCRATSDNTAAGAGPLDPHECNLPSMGTVQPLVSSRSAVVTRQSIPASAPVFRTERPPMATL